MRSWVERGHGGVSGARAAGIGDVMVGGAAQ